MSRRGQAAPVDLSPQTTLPPEPPHAQDVTNHLCVCVCAESSSLWHKHTHA